MRTCSQHSQVPAQFHCEGCNRDLCSQCIEESHALFICRLCGERAVAVGARPEQTPTQRRRAAATSRPYSLKEALTYPFRDTSGRFTLIGLVLLLFVAALAGACLVGTAIRIVLTLAIAGLQFKIVRTTMNGDYEVPNWTDWEIGELFLDWLAWMGVVALQWGLVVLVAWDYGLFRLILSEPSLLFWMMIALCGWLGTALSLMGLGAAANYGRWHVVAIPHHLLAFKRSGGDAVAITNLVFAAGALIPIAQMLVSPLPLVGTLFGTAAAAYWTLVLPHLCGLLFGRHDEDMDAIYM